MLVPDYLEKTGFIREQDSEAEWYDRENIRMVLHNERGGELRWEMFVFNNNSSRCLYSVDFSLDTPHEVVIAVIQAAIGQPVEN